MTPECFIKMMKIGSTMTSRATVYCSSAKKDIPKYALKIVTDEPGNKQINYYHYSTHYDEYDVRTFFWTEGQYVYYLYYNKSEQLQTLLDSGNLYQTVRKDVYNAEKAVDEQVRAWQSTDKEIQLALENGDTGRYGGLMNNLRARAEELIYPKMLFN